MNTDNQSNSLTHGESKEIQFNDIFILEDIQRMQDLFSEVTGVASLITYPDGTPITKPSNFCRLCQLVRSTEKGLDNCIKSAISNCKSFSSEMQLQPCQSAGLLDTGAKISVNGTHIASWSIGQVRNDGMNLQKIIDYGDEIGADKDEYLKALNEVPIMSIEKFQKIFEMLFVMANDYSDKAFKNMQFRKQIAEHKKTNDLLQKSEESLSITLQSIGDGVISTDKDGLIVNMNPVAEQMCGWKLSDATGKQLTEVFNIIHAASRKAVENPVKKVLETNAVIGLANHTILISKKGTEYQIADSAAPIKNDEGIISGVVLVFSDVTGKYRTEKNLIESERSKSVLLANLPGMAYRCKYDRQWTMEFVSEGVSTLTGYSKEDLIDNRTISFNDLILPEYSDYLWKAWKKAVKNHETCRVEYRILTADHTEKWVWEQGIPIFNNQGEVDALEGLIIDITERKNAEAALQNERLLLRTLIDNIPDTIYAKDLAGRKTLANKAEVQLLGADSEDDVLGKDDFEFYPTEFAENFRADDQEVIQTGIPDINTEGFIIDVKGKKHWLHSSKLPLRNKDNQIIGVMGIGRDITVRKEAEEALQRSEHFLRETQVISKLGTYSLSINSNIWSSSEVLDSIFGIASDFDKSFEGWVSIIHPKWQNALKDYVLNYVIGKKKRFDKKYKIIRKNDNQERWVHGLGELVLDQNNQPVSLIGTIQDITERELTTEALKNSEELHRSILNASPDAIVVVEMDGRIRMVSPAALTLYGCQTSEQLIGGQMFDFISPEDRKRAQANSLLMFNGRLGSIEYQILRTDGTSFSAEVNGDIIWDSNHQPNGMVFIIRDSTERKESEESLKSSQLELKEFASHLQSVREEEKIQLAREIHDELGQILIAIKIDLGMMKQNVIKSIKKADAENILINFENLFGLVDNTLNTTRRIMTDLRPEVLHLIGFVEAVKLYINNFKERYQISCLFENSTSALKLNSQQSVALYRILQESLTNIAKHSKASNVKIKLFFESEHFVMVVNDNGVGFKIPPRNKPNSYGLLGMKERVYLLDGKLSISSQPDEGTTIKVKVPYQS
ncbi:MAG: PAS domain S-box protein [Bacteroidota bacterium]|nr:PAS domain S-box protein [Bacteroidota bacterium]